MTKEWNTKQKRIFRSAVLAAAVLMFAAALFVGAGAAAAAVDGNGTDGGVDWQYYSSNTTLVISPAASPEAGYESGVMKDYGSGVSTGNWRTADHRSSVTHVVINDGVTVLGSFAFFSYSQLISAEIPNNIVRFNSSVFHNCPKLDAGTVYLGEELEYFSDSVFCSGSGTSLTKVKYVIDGNNPNYKVVNGILYSKDGKTLVSCPQNLSATFDSAWLTGVETISKAAFRACGNLTGPITIPESVTTIEKQAFQNCIGLTGSLTIPDSVQGAFTSYEFGGCSGLSGELIIGSGITGLGAGTFANVQFSPITIRGTLTSIGGFTGNNQLTEITIPDSVTTISESAFSGCKNLTTVYVPDSVTTISGSAFSVCKNLTNLRLPDSIKSFGDRSIHSVPIHGFLVITADTLGFEAFYMNELHSIIVLGNPTLGINPKPVQAYTFYTDKKDGGIIYVSSADCEIVVNNSAPGKKYYNIYYTSVAITNGGTFANDAVFADGVLATPVKTGYTFEGWYNNTAFTGSPVTTISKVAGIYETYYAKWNTTVSLDSCGGTDGKVNVTYSTASLSDYTAAAKAGYNLEGYYAEEAHTSLVINVSDPANPTLEKDVSGFTDANGKWINADGSAIKLYANWTAIEYNNTVSGDNNVTYPAGLAVGSIKFNTGSEVTAVAFKYGAPNGNPQTSGAAVTTVGDPFTLTPTGSLNGTKAVVNFNITDTQMGSYNPADIRLAHYVSSAWTFIVPTFNSHSNGNYTFSAEVDSMSPFGIVHYAANPAPAPQSSSSHSSSRNDGYSVWLQETAQPTPTPIPTAEPTQAAPVASPVAQPTQTSSSPAPLVGILAGLGAAAVLFGLRRT